MSRAPGPSGMLDIKSAALHMQQVNQTDPCAPGSKLYQRNLEDAKRHSSELDYIVGDEGHEGHKIGENVDNQNQNQDYKESSRVSKSSQGYHSRTRTQSYESHRHHLGQHQEDHEGGLQGGGTSKNKDKDKDKNKRKKDKKKKDDQKKDENYQQEILEIDDENQEEDRRNNRYDRPRDWIITLAAALVVASIIGVMHSFPPLIYQIMIHFKMGLIEVIAVCCLSYAILIAFCPISAVLLEMTGNRVIAMIGIVLFFIGLLLDTFCIHSAVFYFSHLVLLSIGGSLAYTASASIVSDHMRKNLQVGLTIISISAMIGTILFYWLATFLLGYIIYRWVMLCFAIFLLLVLGTVMFFPKRCDAPPEALPWRRCHKRDPKIDMTQGCIEAYRKYDHYDENNECDPVTGKKIHPSYLCVLNCDCSICGDLSFLLWGLLCLLATMSTLIPIIFLPSFAHDLGMNEKSLVVGIVLFCITSLAVRVVLLNYNDHTFFLNRLLFQVACIFSGILYIILVYATTWGWLLLWGGALGITEGIFVIVIPRVALLTVPKDYVVTSWAFTLLFIAAAIVIGPMLVIIVKSCTGAYVVGFMAIGCMQIIAGLLALILPDEENFSNGYDDEECEDFEGQLANDLERQKAAEKDRLAREQDEKDAREKFLETKRNPDYYRELANRLNSYQGGRRSTLRRSTLRSTRSGPEGTFPRNYDPRGGPNSRTNDPRGGPNSRNYDPRGGPNSRTNDPRGGPNSRTNDPRGGPNSRTNDPRGGPNSRTNDPRGPNFDQRRRSTHGKYGPLHVHGDGVGPQEQPRRKSIMEELARARGMSNGDPRSDGGPHNQDFKRRKTLAQEELLEGVRDLRDNVHEQKLEGVGARVPMPIPSNEPKTMYGLDLDEVPSNLRRYLTGKDCDLHCARKKPPRTYTENCAICQMVGCIPGCCNVNCTPGGLAGLKSCDPEPDGNIATKTTVTRQEYDC